MNRSRAYERFLIDLVLWTLAGGIAFFLRLDTPWPEYRLELLVYPAVGVLIKAGMMYLQGTHKPSWHRIGLRDLYQLTRTVAMTTVLMFAVAFIAEPALKIPRSIPILEGAGIGRCSRITTGHAGNCNPARFAPSIASRPDRRCG
jgi:FlaA1/EpsC-like NDP-sugar epimerase